MIAQHNLRLNFQSLRETETRILCREAEIEKILISMSSGIHTYVFGSIGTGKTISVKRAIEKFNDAKSKAIYISCAYCETEYSILREIIDQVNANFAQKIILETRCNFDIARRLKKERERNPSLKVVVLDHLQALREPKIVDCLMEIGFTIILVSDDAKGISKVSALSQSYFANTIHFEDYTQEQLVKIFHLKARLLVGEGLYTESLIAKIAQLSNGNIMYGETLLLAATLEAVREKKEGVDELDIPELLPSGKTISQDERIILDILKESHSMQAGQLYRSYVIRSRFPKAERTFRNYMESLSEKKLVRAVGTNRGRTYELIE